MIRPLSRLLRRPAPAAPAARRLLADAPAGGSVLERFRERSEPFLKMSRADLKRFLDELPEYDVRDQEAFLQFVITLRRLLLLHHVALDDAIGRLSDLEDIHKVLLFACMDPFYSDTARKSAILAAGYKGVYADRLQALVLDLEGAPHA